MNPNNIPKPTNMINVKEFIDSIKEEDDSLMHFMKDGKQFAMTYKRFIQELLEGKTEVRARDIFCPDPTRLDEIAKKHTYLKGKK